MKCSNCDETRPLNRYGFCSKYCQQASHEDARAYWESCRDGQKPVIRQWLAGRRDGGDMYEGEWVFSQ